MPPGTLIRDLGSLSPPQSSPQSPDTLMQTPGPLRVQHTALGHRPVPTPPHKSQTPGWGWRATRSVSWAQSPCGLVIHPYHLPAMSVVVTPTPPQVSPVPAGQPPAAHLPNELLHPPGAAWPAPARGHSAISDPHGVRPDAPLHPTEPYPTAQPRRSAPRSCPADNPTSMFLGKVPGPMKLSPVLSPWTAPTLSSGFLQCPRLSYVAHLRPVLCVLCRMTRTDLRNYLERIYHVPVAAVRTRIQHGARGYPSHSAPSPHLGQWGSGVNTAAPHRDLILKGGDTHVPGDKQDRQTHGNREGRGSKGLHTRRSLHRGAIEVEAVSWGEYMEGQ